MAEALKNIYNEAFFTKLLTVFKQVYPEMDTEQFLKQIYDESWSTRELKQRMRHITVTLHQVLPMDYHETISIMGKAAVQMNGYGLECLFFSDYVEVYGVAEWEISIEALELFTQYSTAEFAVRPFILRDPDRMMAQMLEWASHENHHVRRLASEGCRPRLPWACALPLFKKNPAPILPILELLKADESLYVRKSVANNLNDITKDHPELVLEIAQRWHDHHPHTNWIIKHGCRSLLKKGNIQSLSLFGFEQGEGVLVSDLSLSNPVISIGDSLTFSFRLSLVNEGNDQKMNPSVPNFALGSRKMRIEYALDFVKLGGKVSRKIFKITENTYREDKPILFSKKHSFKDLSTRRHNPGEHKLTIIINGKEMDGLSFYVRES